ncbi:MAG: CpsD/CapB family tyrosine-protein kinase, partial [Phycisphaerales bacterium]|nr:CpsD/CapB family tyrosine-protein kinase [Phycisphaerales bacterium]
VFLFGFMGGGYRFVEEFDDDGGSVNLIGTLPDLSAGGMEEDEMAALSVHHLRNQLQLETRSQPGRGRVLTITSASSGDGKTSLCLSLGMSFAVAGKRTIIVDADLVGRGMTAQLGLRQAEGLVQVVERHAVNGEVTSTPFKGLDVLPAGFGERVEAEHLTQESFGWIVERLRSQYDTVLIDTGPVLGSLEANIASSISDRVVLAVSRGQNPKLVKASLQRIERVGGVCAGIVFNRARLTDLQRSFSHASVVSQSVRSLPASKDRGIHTPKALGGDALTRALAPPPQIEESDES